MWGSMSSFGGEPHNHHLCASPMLKPRKEIEMSQNEEQQFRTINKKFALNTLHDMWKSGKIYYNLGANLLMINPNRSTNYSNTKYITDESISSTIVPFIQNITDNISYSEQNQSIIALGAAGSGKTNTTESIVSHFVSQNSNTALNLVDLWNNISIIYKVFGSHCKRHNVESNGCGRIIKLIYESNGTLQGLLCESLLWHKLIPSLHTTNDVVSGYFHIFSMIMHHPKYAQIPLTNTIKQDDILLSYPLPFKDDRQPIKELQQCMNNLMITSVAQKEIFDVIYSILCLNQIHFITNNNNNNNADSLQSVSITMHRNSLPFAKCVCDILQVDPKDLLQYIMTQTIHTQKQSFIRPHVSVSGAYKKIQRLCYILYECTIEWLFHHIDTLCLNYIHDERVAHFISIIDFPGYSHCETGNDFDQFCSNFCNENLQQLFNSLVLQNNQQLYIEDGLNWIITPIPDYSKVIDLIASPPYGIFQILSTNHNESQILHKINEHHPFKRSLITVAKQYTAFTIQHYSGNVKYDMKDFIFYNNCGVLDKNDDIIPLLNKTNLNIVKHFMKSNDRNNTANAVDTINFQLRNLIKVIKTTNINHILCINPSPDNADAHFSRDYVLSQIKALSIVEMLRDSIHGYCTYIESEKLLKVYNHYCHDHIHPLLSELTAEQKCAAILIVFGIDAKHYTFGLSKVFIKRSALKELRELESFDDAQLSAIQRGKLMRYIQKIKIQKWSGLIKTYCRLNHRLQHQRVFDSIKTTLFLQKCMRKAYILKNKCIGSIPIFEKRSTHHRKSPRQKQKRISPSYDVIKTDQNITMHLRTLFNDGCYYCNINDHISVYLNPYSFSNLQHNVYNQDFLENMVDKIRKNMIENNESQSLILGGEISSGKSTNFFLISNHMISNESTTLNELLWASNQILLSMCHTSSTSNVNASRYIAIRKFSLDKNGNLNGIQQNVKLLSPFICESSNDNCRNFHLFYEICSVLKNDSRFLLEKPSAFFCLNSNIDNAKNGTFGMNDNDECVYFLRALKILNVSTSKQQQICRLSAAILHLSNIQCNGNDNDNNAVYFEFNDFDKQFLFAAAYLLGVKMDKLCDILLPKSSQYFHKSSNTENKSQIVLQILYQRDVLIKSLYELLFQYMNDIINQQFDDYFKDHDADDDDKELFLIDIGGRNDGNRFHNLAANYAFDIVQSYINKQHISEKQKEFVNEIENYSFINTNYDQERLNIIDDTKGIISILDYMDKHKYHKLDSGALLNDMMKNRDYIETDDTRFMLSHYLHDVSYNTKYIFDDAQHFTFDALIELLQDSSLSISRKLIKFYSEHNLFDFGQSFGGNRIHAVIKSCFKYLHENDIDNHYLLCIRPNCNQDASDWNSQLIEQQLNSFYIPQILYVQQSSLRYTLDLIETANRLSIVFGDTPSVLELYAYNRTLFIIALFTVFGVASSSYRIGKRWIFLGDEYMRDKVHQLLNFNTPLPPLQCEAFKKICIQMKVNRVQYVLSTYLRLCNGWNNIRLNRSKEYQTSAIKCVSHYIRFLSPIIKTAKLKVEKDKIQRRKERERLKQEKLRELRRLEMEKRKLEQDCESEKRKRKTELKHLEEKWHNIQNQKQMELARIERETKKAILETQRMADDELFEIKESVFAHINPMDELSVDSSVMDALVEQKHAPHYKQLYNKMYKIQQQIQDLELQKRQSVMNETKTVPIHIVGSPKLNQISIERQPIKNELMDLNYIIHHYFDERERERAKEILKELYKYKQDESKGKSMSPHNVFVQIRSLIKNTKPLIRYDLYKGFEQLILAKHSKIYVMLLKEVKKCGINFREIMRAMQQRDIDGKIKQIERERILQISDILHCNTLLDRNVVLQYLYEIDSILKNLPHKDYVDIVALIEMVVNEHNLPMFVHIFQPLRAQKEFLTKMSFYLSESMYQIFKILLDQMIDNMESDDHKTNLDSIYRDLAKILVKLADHVNMDEVLSEFLLYFVPPEYVYRFHETTKHILSKRYEIIKMAQKNKYKNSRNNIIESEEHSKEYVGDHNILKKLNKEINRLRKTTNQNQEHLQKTVYDQIQQQLRQNKRMENKIDDLQRPNMNNDIAPPIPPRFNEDKLIQRVTDILDNKIQHPQSRNKAKLDSNDAYMEFVNGCFDQFDLNKTDTIPLDTMPQLLDLLDIINPKRQTLMHAFHDMCRLTEPVIHRHQYLSALKHTKGKSFNKESKAQKPPVPPPPPPPPRMIMNKMDTIHENRANLVVFKGHRRSFSGKQPAVIVLPQGKGVEDEEEEIDFDIKKKDKMYTPKIAKLLSEEDCVHGWAMKKGDAFFKPNKKRYIILSSHFFYWCMSDTAQYPKGGLNLYSNHVHVTQHGTSLRIKSSHKERIFNFGDPRTAYKFYNKIVEQKNYKRRLKKNN